MVEVREDEQKVEENRRVKKTREKGKEGEKN